MHICKVVLNKHAAKLHLFHKLRKNSSKFSAISMFICCILATLWTLKEAKRINL